MELRTANRHANCKEANAHTVSRTTHAAQRRVVVNFHTKSRVDFTNAKVQALHDRAFCFTHATTIIVIDVVEQAMKDGELKQDDVLQVSMTIWAVVHGLAALHRSDRFDGRPGRFRKVYERSMAQLFAGLVA